MINNMEARTKRDMKKLLLVGFFFALSFAPLPAFAARLYFYPQSVSLAPDEEALIDIRIDTEGEVINAVEIEGAVSGVATTLRKVDNAGSALTIFVERPSVEGRSRFRLVGGAPGGITGEHLLARVSLRGELPGSANLSFSSSLTKALLADGTGNKAKLSLEPASLTVIPRSRDHITITSQTHPDQNQWYRGERAQLQFTFSTAHRYSYLVSRDPLAEPDDTPDVPEGTAQWQGGIKIDDLPEGVSYFSVKKVGAAVISRYRLMRDDTPPQWLEIRSNDGTIETEGRPFISFLAHDAISGVEYYEMRVDGNDPISVVSPQPFPESYTILSVRAYDRAGNYVEEFIPGPQKEYGIWVWAAILFVLLVWVSGIIDTGKRKQS